MAIKKTKNFRNLELLDKTEYGHFYVPDDVTRFLINLTNPVPIERILSIGLMESKLKTMLDKQNNVLSIPAEFASNKQDDLNKKLFDVILCAPLFGVITPDSNEPNEETWLRWGIEHLSDSGRLAIIVPAGLLSNYSQEPIRRYLLEHGGLEGIIQIPSGWAFGTAIEASILFITTNTHPERPVKMFSFSDIKDVAWNTLHTQVLKPEIELSNSYKAYTISASQLESARLDVKYYDPSYSITSPNSNFDSAELGDLVDIRSGERFSDSDAELNGIPFIQVKNVLMDGSLNLHEVKTIKHNVAIDSRSYSQTDDIIITIAGTIGKVAIIPAQAKVCIDTSLRRLRIRDKSHILPEYLALYLRSATTRIQIDRMSSGSVIKVLSTPNLENIVVYFPSIEHQREIVEKYTFCLRERQEKLLSCFPNLEKMEKILQFVETISTKAIQQLPITQKKSLDEIVETEFPYPFSRAFTIYKNISQETASARLKKLINISESVVYYIYGILVSDYLQRIKPIESELNTMLLGSIQDFSIDRRIKFITRVLKHSIENPTINLFIPELADGAFGICSEIHNNVRNKFSHTDITEPWCKKAIAEYEPKILKLLTSLLPIKKYRLVQVTNVTIRDGRPQHHIMSMMGNNSVFATQVEDLDILLPADTQHIILLNDDYNVLDLHPFYMIHAWESTGMQNHLCFLKLVTGTMLAKQKIKLESADGVGETEVDMDLRLGKYLAQLGID